MNGNNDDGSIILSSKYSGACEHVPLSNEDLLKLTNEDGLLIHGPRLFSLKYRVLPCTAQSHTPGTRARYSDTESSDEDDDPSLPSPRRHSGGSKHNRAGIYHANSVMQFLTEKYKADPNTFVYEWNFSTRKKNSLISTVYIDLGNYLSVQFAGGFVNITNMDNPYNLKPDQQDGTFNCFRNVQIFHVRQTQESARRLFEDLLKFQLFPITEATLQMVCHNDRCGFYTTSIRMKKPHITDLKLHYGDEFLAIHERLLKTLEANHSTGISFLHGPPGTGKTYYLRYLINEIESKRLIYVPPDLVNDMTKPGFLPFLMEHPNSILIVEDAENIIRDRKHDVSLPNQAVANLLNLSDGLLGDAMHQQIICTFNCDVQCIDPALLRDGRLVIEHKFDKLVVQDARRLCVELGIAGNGDDINEPISLAEIYARKNVMGEEPLTTKREKNPPKRKRAEAND